MSMTLIEALQTLELSPDYTMEELENARKVFKMKYHPDKAGHDELKKDLMTQKYALGQEAYEVLKSNLNGGGTPNYDYGYGYDDYDYDYGFSSNDSFYNYEYSSTNNSDYNAGESQNYWGESASESDVNDYWSEEYYEKNVDEYQPVYDTAASTKTDNVYSKSDTGGFSKQSKRTNAKKAKKIRPKMSTGKKIIIVILAIFFLPGIFSCTSNMIQNAIGVNFDPKVGKAGIDFSYTDIKQASDVGINYLGEGKYSVGVALKNENKSFVLRGVRAKFVAYGSDGEEVGRCSTTVNLPIAPGDTFYAGQVFGDCTGAVETVEVFVGEGDTEWYTAKDFVYDNPLVVESASADENCNYQAVVRNSGDVYIGDKIDTSIAYMKDGLPIYACESSDNSVKLEPGESCTISGEGYGRSLITGFDDVTVKTYKKVKL